MDAVQTTPHNERGRNVGDGVPRPERPLNVGDGPVAGFADELRRLRQQVGGPGYRELARRAHYSATTLAEAARGDRFPSLAVTLAYVRACGGSVEEWETRWQEVAAQLAAKREPADEDESAPYRGLETFQTEDANRFFGRARLVAELTAKVSTNRFTAVFGPSGVGKSSLLRAGLVPRLADIADVVVMTPGPHPVEECAARLTGSDRLVLVVDQFEEVFTLCHDDDERAAFIAMVTNVCEEPGPVSVVLGIRADFFARCAEYPALVAALREAQVLVGPMSQEDLREIVVRPAHEQGCTVEGALLAAISADATRQAGALPLVSHALLETWRRRRGNTLTLAGYQAAGGIDGALAATAERTYAALNNDQQRAARDLFLRLTAFGEGTEHTKRRVARAEVAPEAAPLLEVFARARLITLAESTVELAHEALIRSWPRLGRWLADDRDGLRVHRQLTEATHTWQALGRDDGALYRGVRLALTREWVADRHLDLTPVEREFLARSGGLADAEQTAAARRARVLRYLTAGLAVLLTIAAVLGIVAWQQRGEAIAMHRVAVSRQVAGQAVALARSQPDTAMLLSAAAFRLSPTVEARGALLSTAATETYQGELAGHTDAVSRAVFSDDGAILATVSRDQTLMLWDVSRRARIARLTGHDTWLRTVAVSPDSRYAVTGGDDATVVVWDLPRRAKSRSLTGHRERIEGTVFSPDGNVLVTADSTGTIIFWDTHTWTRTTTVTVSSAQLRALSVSPDGRSLIAATEAGHVHVWDLPSRTARFTIAAHPSVVADLAVSPDSALLATASYDGSVGLWRLADGSPVARLAGHADEVRAVEFTADGKSVVSAGLDRTVMLWDIRMRMARARMTGLTHSVYALAVHPGTGVVATAGEDREIVLWNPTRPTLLLPGDPPATSDIGVLGGDAVYSQNGRFLVTAHNWQATVWDTRSRLPLAIVPGTVDTVAVSPNGRLLATASGNRSSIDVWDMPTMTRVAELAGPRGPVLDLAFSPNGALVAAGVVDGTVALWDVHRKTRWAELVGHTGPVNGVAFSPDGHTLATAGHDNLLMLWDIRRSISRHLATLTGHQSWIRNVAFSPDGRTLASASVDRTVRLWNVGERRLTTTLTGHTDAASGIAFSPDGRLLAFTSDDHTVTLWDIIHRATAATLSGHTETATAITFSPDSATLASVSLDHTAIIWPTQPETAAAHLCSTLKHELTTTEWDRTIPDIEQFPICPPP
jgi:WD40 repeat protein